MHVPARRLLTLCILLSCTSTAMAGAQTFTFEAMGGSAYNFPTPLTVSQAGYPDIRLSAHYDTKPFGPFYPYYSWRTSASTAKRGSGLTSELGRGARRPR